MSVDYTTAGLIDAVKLRAMVPTSQSLFTDARILTILNDVQYAMVVPWMMSQRQDFFKTYVDIPVDPTTSVYKLPRNTVGEKIQGIYYGADTNQPGQIDWDACAQVDVGDVYDKNFRTSRGFSYSISSDVFTVWPRALEPSKFFRVWYYRRPSALVLPSDCGKVNAVNTGTNTLSLASAPSSWNTTSMLDIIEGTPHFSVLGTSAPSSISTLVEGGAIAKINFTITNGSGNYALILNFQANLIIVPWTTSDDNTASLIANAINTSIEPQIQNYLEATVVANTVTIQSKYYGFMGNTVQGDISGTNITDDGIPSQGISHGFKFFHGGAEVSSNPSTFDYTFASLPTAVKIGDYLALSGETCVPQLPYEIWPYLVHGAVVQCLKVLGNPSWQAAEQELQRTMQNARSLIGPRVDEEPKKLVSSWW